MSDTRTYRQRLIDRGWSAGEHDGMVIRIERHDLSWLLVIGQHAATGYWWDIRRTRNGHSYAQGRKERNILRAADAALLKLDEVAREFSCCRCGAEMTV